MKKHFFNPLILLLVVATASAQNNPPADKLPQSRNLPENNSRRAAAYEMSLVRPMNVAALPQAAKNVNLNPARRAAAHSDLPELYGCVLSRADWTSATAAIGVYQLPTATGEEFVSFIPKADATQGGVCLGGNYIATNSKDFGSFMYVTISAYDMETKAVNAFISSMSAETVCFDATVDPTSDKVYAITYNSNKSSCQLTEIVYSFGGSANSATPRSIAPLDGQWNAIAADKDGVLYGIKKIMGADGATCASSQLVKFDKETGSYSVVGETGHMPLYVSSATIDAATNRMFWAVSNNNAEGYLCEVDLATGAATRILDFPGSAEVTGLFVKPAPAAGGVPAAPENLTAVFKSGALEGTVGFTIPAGLADGTPASGTVAYSVKANGTEVAQGSANFGASVEVPVVLGQAGLTEFTVILTNDAGESAPASISLFVGKGVPEAPADVEAYWQDEQMHISWTAVDAAADGGYIDPAAVTYIVTLDGATVEDNITGTSVAFNLEAPESLTRYKYHVAAVYDGKSSTPTPANAVYIGVAQAPYNATLNDADDMAAFKVIDANSDGQRWQYYRQSACVMSNNQKDADDWLISAPVYLEAGYVYRISTEVYGSAFSDERFELKIGDAPTAGAMTTTLVESTDLKKVGTPTEYSGKFAPTASGTYYVGLHGISPRFQFALYTKGIKVDAGVKAAKPAEGSLAAIPDATGAYSIKIEMTHPAVDLVGEPLTALLKSELYRGDILLTTNANPAPGSTTSYTDVLDAGGPQAYRFVVYTAVDEYSEVSVASFAGTDKPAKVQGIRVTEPTVPGSALIEWQTVTQDHNGYALNPGKVTYSVYTVDEKGNIKSVIAENISATSATASVCGPDDDQRFVQFAVTAQTEGGMSVAASELLPVGKPYSGMVESFANASASYIFGINSYGTAAAWILADDNAFLYEKSVDDDNGFIYFMATAVGDKADMFSGKIDLAGMKNPALKFYTYPFANDDNLIEVKVREAGGDYRTLLSKKMKEITPNSEWIKVVLPLSDFAGKTIQLSILVQANANQFSFIDKLAVEPDVDHDLSIPAITAGRDAKAGNTFPVKVTVENKGNKPSGKFRVDLYSGSDVLATAGMEQSVEPEKTVVLTLMPEMPRFADETEFHARVVYDKDEVPGNDLSPTITVARIDPEYPAVENLKGIFDAQCNTIAWDAPGLDCPDREVSETFDEAEPWAQTYGDWLFIDRDGGSAGGIAGMTIPGIRPGKEPTSYFIFDYLDGDWGETFTPVSGRHFLASLYSLSEEIIDDWAISPELNGDAQTISFMAKSYRDIYPCTIELYYSTGSTDPDDFKLLPGSRVEAVPAEWTAYRYNLPSGAERFALRHCSNNTMLLMLDDFEFTQASVSKGLTTLGYDIYRDQTKTNNDLCAATTWADNARNPEATHTYTVIPVYNRGEGRAAHVKVSKFDSLDMPEGGNIRIYAEGRSIVVTGAVGLDIRVMNPAGITTHAGIGAEKSVIPATPGIWIVKVGPTTAKVIVK